MLSIEKCRELIPDSELYSDAEITKIRDNIYQLGELALEDYFRSIEESSGKEVQRGGSTEDNI